MRIRRDGHSHKAGSGVQLVEDRRRGGVTQSGPTLPDSARHGDAMTRRVNTPEGPPPTAPGGGAPLGPRRPLRRRGRRRATNAAEGGGQRPPAQIPVSPPARHAEPDAVAALADSRLDSSRPADDPLGPDEAAEMGDHL